MAYEGEDRRGSRYDSRSLFERVAVFIVPLLTIGSIYMGLNNKVITQETELKHLAKAVDEESRKYERLDASIHDISTKIISIHTEISSMVSNQSNMVLMLNRRIKVLEKSEDK